MASMGQTIPEEIDPRIDGEKFQQAPASSYIRPQHRKLHDPSVSFEEYHYYAVLARAEEDEFSKQDIGDTTFLSLILPSKSAKGNLVHSTPSPEGINDDEKTMNAHKNISGLEHGQRGDVTDAEWQNASRALRTASWSAVFYLITTDILGPFNVPWAMGTLGWGPGIALYTVFGGLAVYGGFLLYYMFLGLDSHNYPMRTYGDIAFRVYGTPVRHGLNLLQSIQLLCNVGVIIIANGQALSQVSKFHLCYAVCCLVFALAGFFVGQVRTLQKYGWFANAAIWMNFFIMITTMGVVAHSKPNYAAIGGAAGTAIGSDSVIQNLDGSWPAVQHSASLPASTVGFIGAVDGLMQAVYAYGGAMLFTEFMSEMKHPRDFWKGMICAQVFIYIVYIFYGCFLYGYQGQYTVNPSYQGVSVYAWQTVGNIIGFLSALIAAGLYGNIGIKVIYNNVFTDFFHAPPLSTKKGKLVWLSFVPVYWTVAFIIAASIPNFFGLTSLVAALCILQFTYTFPPFLFLGFKLKLNAMQEGEGFDPHTGVVTRHDSGLKRIMRGYRKTFLFNTWNLIFFLGSLVTAALGAYSAIESLINAFKNPQVTAFTCHSPLDST